MHSIEIFISFLWIVKQNQKLGYNSLNTIKFNLEMHAIEDKLFSNCILQALIWNTIRISWFSIQPNRFK